MKIGYVTNYLPLYHNIWGGAEQACMCLAKGLKESNVDITIITNKTDKESKDFKMIFIKRGGERNLFGRTVRKFVPLDYYNPLLILEFRKILKEQKLDLIHLQNFSTFSVSIIKEIKRFDIPVCFSVYDYWLICPNSLLMYRFKEACSRYHSLQCKFCLKGGPFGDYPYINTFERILFRDYLKLIDRFIVLTFNSREILQSYGILKEKIEVIPLPLYEAINVGQDTQEGLILFVGWLSINKGLHIIIEAMPKILRNFSKAHLWIVETGEISSYKEYILTLISSLSLQSNIKFLGKLKPDELKGVLRKANVVVIPEQWQNPCPLILCEAINFKRPIVASRIGGICEVVTINEFLAQYDNPDDFSDKVLWILKNKDKAFELAESLNLKASRMFDSKTNLDKIVNLYRKLIK